MEDNMRWKQFLTPVKSFDSDETRKYLADKSPDAITILDVRQPGEYEGGHLPGAKLIPLPDLTEKLDELDPNKPTMVY
jgi:rhodanese-related sulfurtransferase